MQEHAMLILIRFRLVWIPAHMVDISNYRLFYLLSFKVTHVNYDARTYSNDIQKMPNIARRQNESWRYATRLLLTPVQNFINKKLI
jgi:hypothetical protein